MNILGVFTLVHQLYGLYCFPLMAAVHSLGLCFMC